MYLLQRVVVECPYCAEAIDIVIDASIAQQHYIEDCSVCCRPLHLTVSVTDAGKIQVLAQDENAC